MLKIQNLQLLSYHKPELPDITNASGYINIKNLTKFTFPTFM